MEILGIGPGEFMLILIVLLVAVGPERLPGLARQAGRLLVRGRNWLQSSPDAALILRARQEIEQELATLRSSLLEVQSVRDEVIGAVKQAEGSIGSITSTRIPFDSGRSIAPPAAAQETASPAEAVEPFDLEELPPAPDVQPPVASPPVVPELRLDQWSVARTPAPTPRPNGVVGSTPATAALDSIQTQLQAIMADLHALQTQLKARGVLDDDWRPPSWDISAPEPAAPSQIEETGR